MEKDWNDRFGYRTVMCKSVEPAWDGAWNAIRFPGFYPHDNNEIYGLIDGKERLLGLREVRLRGFSFHPQEVDSFRLSPTAELFLRSVVPEEHYASLVASIRRRVNNFGSLIDGPMWVGMLEDKPESEFHKVDPSVVITIESKLGRAYPKWARLFAQTSDTDIDLVHEWRSIEAAVVSMQLSAEVRATLMGLLREDVMKLQQWWKRALPTAWRVIAKEYESDRR